MFSIIVPFLDLQQIYDSFVAARWIKLKDNRYVIIYKDKAVKVEQTKERLLFNCSQDEFMETWFEYFDMRRDYSQENFKIKNSIKKIRVPANRGKGIRIINQEPFEMYLYSLFISEVGFEKARKALVHIANTCGKKHEQSMKEMFPVEWHEFPSPQEILDNFDNLKRMGKINDLLKKFCTSVINDNVDYNSAFELNKKYFEFSLFEILGMRKFDIFPVNEIEETIQKNFKTSALEFCFKYLENIESKCLVYFYILHHIKNPPIILKGEIRPWGSLRK